MWAIAKGRHIDHTDHTWPCMPACMCDAPHLPARPQLLVRHGVSEADVDMETRALLAGAAECAEHGEGVSSVLLAGALARIDELEGQLAMGRGGPAAGVGSGTGGGGGADLAG